MRRRWFLIGGAAASLVAGLGWLGIRLVRRDPEITGNGFDRVVFVCTNGAGDFRDGGVADNFEYWASSQQTADMAVHIDFADLGRQHGDDKDFPRRVRAIRAF